MHFDWPDAGKTTRGLIDGPAGAIQTTVSRPKTQADGFALVCHPHPQYGGTQDNKVVTTLTRAANELGLTAIRFNFRGVGDSEGSYDEGRGETDDARAVRDWACAATSEQPALLAGFSFGSAVALRLAHEQPAPALITVGFPAAYFESEIPRPDTRWLALFGSDDDVIDVQSAIERTRAVQPPPEVQIMDGAGHFLHGRLTDLRRRVSDFMELV